MLLQALQSEIERNLDLVRSTRELITERRDMLQGDVKKRMVLYPFHTDVWETATVRDDVPISESIASCYFQLQELNELVDKFDEEGNAIIHSPLFPRNANSYGRDNVLTLLNEKCAEAEERLRDAYKDVEELLERTCPVCEETLADAEEMEQHRDQHTDSDTDK